MSKPREIRNLEILEISFSIHPKDHEPDWTDPQWGVCRRCGLGRVREVVKDDERTEAPPNQGG